MDALCGIVMVIVIGYVIMQIFKTDSKLSAERKAQMEEKLARIKVKENVLDNLMKKLKTREKELDESVRMFFADPSYSYTGICDLLNISLQNMQFTIEQMKNQNEEIVKEAEEYDQSDFISRTGSSALTKVKKVADCIKQFKEKVYILPFSRMMDIDDYGKINKKYWDEVETLERTDAMAYIEQCQNQLDGVKLDEILTIDIEKVLKCVWFFAIEKTFSAGDFGRAYNVFMRIYKMDYPDIIIADLYAKRKVGGEEILREPINDLLKKNLNSMNLTLIASGLMWMKAYQSEHTILQHMLTSGAEMSVKTQERLHALTNGGGKAPSGFAVRSSDNSLYFDISALAWKEDEYIGFFENLAFQEKTLTYSLAVRDENKELLIANGIKVPEINNVLNKFKIAFEEEYGSGVVAKVATCTILSGSGEEKMEGILVSSNECRQMGILIHIVKIGKKLSIKFYTLFMPTETDRSVQKQQVLSMYQKLSPSVTMWESSLKDTMLIAVEQLLNAGIVSAETQSQNVQSSQNTNLGSPVF